jgi:hypothetical protein
MRKGEQSLEEKEKYTVEVDLLLSLYKSKAELTAEKTLKISSSQSAKETQRRSREKEE